MTDRLLDFLNGFPWNPVTPQLPKTRETILHEMEEHHVRVDPARLTDVNLLRGAGGGGLMSNAGVFWVREDIGPEALAIILGTYQIDRDKRRRGIVEMTP